MFCTECGTKTKEGVQFCTNCGKSLIVPAQTVTKKKIYHTKKIILVSLLSIVAIIIIAVWLSTPSTVNETPQTNLSEINSPNLGERINRFDYNPNNNSIGLNQLENKATSLEKNKPSNVSNESGLPKLNYNAVVLILCRDNQNNYQQGSGTIVSGDGVIITNKHVVTDDYGEVLNCGMLMQNNDSVLYGLAAPDTTISNTFDAALLKVSSAYNFTTDQDVALPSSFPYFQLSYTKPDIGTNIFILGYPAVADYVFNVSKGIVSSFSADGVYLNTDAKIDHGNSGGAVITTDGKFVGIPTQRYAQDGDYLGQILRLDALENDY